ncbi:hypothetical protein ABL78_3806 [Leptomonas seymouri]|uniref:Uncharacterized protein n=1 Tax=Leptomonas seymouri TaxID=5684 RepID=A0A0N1HXE1_LEPSE|nr:hypothetical protein ABL78_3806 [Leptomonas seymouri]|eukprot:KPI87094.1 hypothetical protein ABL78_3806 [Leptomonas seymouri]
MSAPAALLAGVLPVRALLSPFGIGISRRISFARCSSKVKGDEISVQVTGKVAAGTPLLILADTAVLTCQAVLDADVDGLAPPPAEMLGMLQGDTVRLDDVYLAYYLSLRYFSKPNDWYATQVDLCSTAHSGASGVGAASALWERAAREYVSAPQPLFLAALRYVRASSFFKPFATAVHPCAPSQQPARAIAPVLDLLVRSEDKANVSLMACTAKDVAQKYLSADLRGARQALLSKDDACEYWAVLASDDLPVGSTVSLSPQSPLTSGHTHQ